MRLFTFVAALILLPLSGCGLVSVGYNNADIFLRYTIHSYAPFDDMQKEIISKDVDSFLEFHRHKILPEYVVFLQGLLRTTQSGKTLQNADARRMRVELRSLYIQTLRPTIQPVARLLSTVSSAQKEKMRQSLADKNKLNATELDKNIEARYEERAEKIIDFLESIVGDFSDTQLEKIRILSRELPLADSTVFRQRTLNQAKLMALMNDNKGEELIAAHLSTWLLTPEAYRSPEDQRIIFSLETASEAFIVNLYQMLNERQKKELQQNIVKYIDTFQALSLNH